MYFFLFQKLAGFRKSIFKDFLIEFWDLFIVEVSCRIENNVSRICKLYENAYENLQRARIISRWGEIILRIERNINTRNVNLQ